MRDFSTFLLLVLASLSSTGAILKSSEEVSKHWVREVRISPVFKHGETIIFEGARWVNETRGNCQVGMPASTTFFGVACDGLDTSYGNLKNFPEGGPVIIRRPPL